jgi:hypothetical protein
VHEVLVADLVDLPLGAERLLRLGSLCALVDQRADLPVERAAVGVPLDEVLLDLRPDLLHQEAQVPDDRVVAQDRVVALEQVVDAEPGQSEQRPGGQPPPGADPDGEPEGGQREDRDAAEIRETGHSGRLSDPSHIRRCARRNLEGGSIRCQADSRRDSPCR